MQKPEKVGNRWRVRTRDGHTNKRKYESADSHDEAVIIALRWDTETKNRRLIKSGELPMSPHKH